MSPKVAWHRELNRYHWFVLIVAALGWLFDTMDQQLFNLARAPAMMELLTSATGEPPAKGEIDYWGGIATAIFLMGWASGGLFFGMLGDRVGRAKTMMLTILLYSLFTGLSSFSQGVWDFAFYRFLTGLGVGGEFAVGVALVAEVMPSSARPFALGFLQALSAVGNIMAALISIGLGSLEESGVIGTYQLAGFTVTAWRVMFVVGTLPALLALIIRKRLKEPEQWQQLRASGSGKQQLGSYAELFGDKRWRHRTLVGLVLATSGVIGLWGIGFFSIDLNRSVFRKVFEQEMRDKELSQLDRDLLRHIVQNPASFESVRKVVKATDLLNSNATMADALPLWNGIQELSDKQQVISSEALIALLDGRNQTADERAAREAYLSGTAASIDVQHVSAQISQRGKAIAGRLTRWTGYTSIMLNIGGFFGIYGFSVLSQRIGRRMSFALGFVAAGLSTALVFSCLNDLTDVFWMIPLMGFCQLSLFGGYAVYFPELFPTRLRSTGTSFCYNVGRFVAATGPFTLGYLTKVVFADYPEPMRYAGVTMCSIFVLGLLALPFAPETRDQPLPE